MLSEEKLLNGLDDIIDFAAKFLHELWCKWSKNVAASEPIHTARYVRWQNMWVNYDRLSEKLKNIYRAEARRLLSVMIDAELIT